MNSNKIVIWGASGFSLTVSEIIRLRNEFEIAGYLDDVNPQRKGEKFNNSIVLGGKYELGLLYKKGIKNIILAFGDCKRRLQLSFLVKSLGFSLQTAIHPKTIISQDSQIGKGSIIEAGSIIDARVSIGESCIINRGSLIGHETVIGDGVHVAPGVNIAGGVAIGKGTFVGIGSTIINDIKIGINSIIGAGSVVVKDIPDNVVAYGVPAKIIKTLS